MMSNHISQSLRRLSFSVLVALPLVLTMSACSTTSRMEPARPVALNSSPSDMSELHVADVALESGDTSMATTIYERIARKDPHSVPALMGLGNTLYEVGDFTRAGVYFSRAAEVGPTVDAPQIGLARVAIRQRRFDDATALYRKVLQRSPGNSIAACGLGTALDMQGQHKQAQDVFRAALLLHPGDPLLSVNLGLSFVMGGDPRQGANVLLDVARYPSAPPQARQDLALAYGLLGETDAARRILAADLPSDQVEDNLHFYSLQRAAMFPASSASAPSAAVDLGKANNAVAVSKVSVANPALSSHIE